MYRIFCFLLVYVCVVLPYGLSAQCPDAPLNFQTQAAVDSFGILYPNCAHYNFGLLIGGPDQSDPIVELTPLSGLRSLQHGITISRNALLTDLTPLSGITQIGSSVVIHSNKRLQSLEGLENIPYALSLTIVSNDSLASIEGLSGLREIGRGLTVEGNPMLRTLEGLNHIKDLTELRIYQTSLTSLRGLDSLEEINPGHITMSLNKRLKSFDGLESMRQAGPDSFNGEIWWIEYNDSLESVAALSNLAVLNMNLFFRLNPRLGSLEGLERVSCFYGSLKFIHNNSLMTLAPINDWMHQGFELFIWDNANLDTCHVESVCTYLKGFEFRSIQGNKPNCNSEAAILALCEGSVSVDQADDFDMILFPNPAYDVLFLDGTHELSRIGLLEFVDIQGNIALTHPLMSHANPIEISIADLAPGMYFLRLNSLYISKLVVR